jgi:hypothetical protein
METKRKKKIIRPHELILLILTGFFLLYMGMQALGVSPSSRSEEVTWLDRPTGPEAPITLVNEERDQRVNETLENIAVQFAEDKRRNRTTSKSDLRRKGLSDDEAEYLQDVQERKDEGKSAGEWVETIKTSYDTYKMVKGIFDQVDGRTDDYVPEAEVDKILSDPELKNRTFSNMERTFNIARPQLEAFAKRGGGALNDWATFVDQNRR